METTEDLKAQIDRFRAGDQAAIDRLIERAYARLERLTRKMLNDFRSLRGQVETLDVLHSSFARLRAALTQTEFDSVPAFYRLAGTVMRRQLIDLHRRHFGPQGSGANIAAASPIGDKSTADQLQQSDLTHEPARLAQWAEFHRQVEALPEEEREAFDLLWYQEMTQQEAADVAGVSLATLKRRWMSARMRLQALLSELTGAEDPA